MAEEKKKDWNEYKEKGDFHYKIYQFVQAVDSYNYVIDHLEKRNDDQNTLIDLYCKRSSCYCHIAEGKTGTQRLSLYNLALKDADFSLKHDPMLEKGLIQKASALLGLNLRQEGTAVLSDLLKSYDKKGLKATSNQTVLLLLRQYKYYTDERVVKSCPQYGLCRYPNHVGVIDSYGAGLYDDIYNPLAVLKEASLLLKPDRYVFSIEIKEYQNFDIIGDTRDCNEDVTLEITGSIGSSAFLPLITVSGGTLHLSNFNVVHKCIEEPTDTIVVNNGGKCNITNVQFQGENSTFCLLQHSEVSIGKCRLIGGSTAISVSNSSTLKLTDTVISAFTHVGVNIISGASANIQKSTVSCCGQHAILSHNGAQRVELIHSKIISNSNCQEGHVPAVQLSAGKQNLIRHCEILKNGGPGIRITHGSECAIEDSIFKQNPIAINVIGRSRCSIIRCRMVEVSVGLDILHNQNGQVFMKDNTIKPSIAEVMMLSSDSIPTMVGRLHKVKLRDDVSSKHIRTPRLETLQKVVAPKKFVR